MWGTRDPAPDVLYVANAVPNPDAIFEFALREGDWDAMRVRRTASFGASFDFSGKTYPERAMPSWLLDVARVVRAHVAFRLLR